MNYSESTLYISSESLRHNIDWIRSKTESTFVCPMVKANSYGGGAIKIAQELQSLGITHMGVARLSEAEELRQNHVTANILLFNHFTRHELEKILDLNLTCVVSSTEQLSLLSDFLKEKRRTLKVHLEFDTGMSRLGFQKAQIEVLKTQLAQAPEVQVEGVFTHFLDAGNWPHSDGSSAAQYKAFEQIASEFPQALPHIASSKALENEPGKIKFGLRPGLWVLGIQADKVGLLPVLRLVSPIISMSQIPEGQSVSYSAMWKAPRSSVIATLPVGYADGYSRRLTGQSHVIIRGHRVPTVGAICMDYMMVDVTDIQDQVRIGDEATVIGLDPSGQNISIESLAEKCGVFVYEFVVRLSRRLRREIVGGASEAYKPSSSGIQS